LVFWKRFLAKAALTASFGKRREAAGHTPVLKPQEFAMTYRITGLDPEPFAALVGADDATLAAKGAVRVTAAAKPGYPCRITLQDAEPGETLILVNHVSHDVATPYRSAYAIYVRESASETASFEDALPPVFENRPIAFRAFDAKGMLRNAALALPGEADTKIRTLFDQSEIAYLHAHNAAHGCFAAKVERSG
jgi:Protein of unknown function (DUF1203)